MPVPTADSSIPWATALTEAAVTFLPDGRAVPAGGGRTVLELSAATGSPLRTVCGGIGNCTSCRVRVVTGHWPAGRQDRERLGSLVEQGWRLACQFAPKAPVTVERPPADLP
ncbi:MAG: 2Fe-2S iron-sulfur cluster binding domain-containing protein [Gemmatimonadetes bacterium]|nr:2Fe-2S iron-sulfur cluster binding domain-containing protein [Gemmatimonadota bacterium]